MLTTITITALISVGLAVRYFNKLMKDLNSITIDLSGENPFL